MQERGLYYSPNEHRSQSEIMDKIARETTVHETVLTPAVADPLSFEEHWGRLLELQSIRKETSLWKDELEITVNTGDFPYFAFRPISDAHIGALGTNYSQLQQHFTDIRELPVYTAVVGDLGDMFGPTKHPEGMMGDAIPPDDQLSMMRRFFESYKEKILCTVQDPSHTDWVRQVSGIEPQRYLVEGLGINALKSGGLVTIHVNDITYRLLLFHQIGRFNSSLNVTNAGKRMLDLHQSADVVVSGHTHIGSMEKGVRKDGKPMVVQLGTFKTSDEFGERKGLVPRPQVFFPTLFFDGRRKNIEAIEDREAAIEYINTFMRLQSIMKGER